MMKIKEISKSLRNQAVGLFRGGNHTYRQISSLLNVSLSSIHSIVSRWKKFGNPENLPRSGRPRKLLQRDIRVVKRIVRKNRFKTLKLLSNQVNESSINISKRTLGRTLKEIGFKSCMRAKKLHISEKNRKQRLSFYLNCKSFSPRDWADIIWSDESRFKLFNSDGRVRVWRESNQRFNPNNVTRTLQGNGGSVLVWGCYYGNTLGPLIFVEQNVTSHVYITRILGPFYKNFYIPSIEYGKILTFQQDNAPAHMSKRTRNWFTAKKIPLLRWPPPEPRYEFDRVPIGLNRKKNKFTKCVANISNPTKIHAKRGVGTNLSERIGRIDQLNAKKVGRIEKGQRDTNKILKMYITRIKLDHLLHNSIVRTPEFL
ncbi:hypothetical protein LOD99_1508 [Oopsacas minuta]|uniref:Transposase Tc1-like domain-containing protein n=1 Tax=Oopsacas minuta TaxID=111878 RepID=A0AAV7K534_9METZ|nr:hypothetical protein LOD99_1508 [Oopsacas minuta]